MTSKTNDQLIYSIPARFRRIENLHILLWLLKDICWALSFRIPGLIMIVPTMAAALIITWQTRKMISELMHNLAVVFWITANCLWMIGEFFGWDEGLFGLRHFALVPFGIGLLLLAIYYLLYFVSKNFREKVALQSVHIIEDELSLQKHNNAS